ncbi:hypothetical protein ACFQZV_02980 [Microbacterium koreense]|uniref:DUF3846 domain-containing protein n=1 Tax=Microbacterium koreense TaxID=323761 RepID=A0ABW2ZNP5_9MICO
MTESTSPEQGLDVGLTTWSAPNPFGEPTAYVLVHPLTRSDDGPLLEAITGMGLKRLDTDGDILPIGTDVLFASLRALRVELSTPSGVWLSQPVTDDWTANAIGRRYVVLVVGTEPLRDDADAEALTSYLADRTSIFAALVKIRVRVENP